ncbi:MAG TPA: LL-diaminopimelate aminotransferase, partial [Ruminococcaceae bacterium]|nr:LL-diaminopimelate aminotransferase [Oscillospiraceae bacterium]
MKRFNTSIFSVMAEMKQKELAKGKTVFDLSVGTPNIPPAPHIIKALVESAQDTKNYVYALSDTDELQDAVSGWYRRRYGVELDP